MALFAAELVLGYLELKKAKKDLQRHLSRVFEVLRIVSVALLFCGYLLKKTLD